jgi:hypothetical protein
MTEVPYGLMASIDYLIVSLQRSNWSSYLINNYGKCNYNKNNYSIIDDIYIYANTFQSGILMYYYFLNQHSINR